MFRRVITLITLSLGIVAAGCNSEMPENPNILTSPPTLHSASLYVVNAVPNSDKMDIYVDGTKMMGDLGYRKSSGNLAVAAGNHQVTLIGAGSTDLKNAYFSNYVLLREDDRVLVTAMGRDDEATGRNFSVQRLSPNSASAVSLRMLHASPAAPILDVSAGDAVMSNQVAFGQLTAGTAIASGDLSAPLTLSLAESGAKFPLARVTLPGPYSAGAQLTAIVFGETHPLAVDDKFFAVSLLDEKTGQLSDLPLTINNDAQAPKASLYFFHAGMDAGPIDIYSPQDGNLVAGFSYEAASKLIEKAGGIYPIMVRKAGESDSSYQENFKLFPGTSWTVFYSGRVNPALQARFAAPIFSAVERRIKGDAGAWRLVHTIFNSGGLDLHQTADGPALFSTVYVKQATNYRTEDLVSSTLHLKSAPDAKDQWDITVSQADADSARGEITTFYLTGSVSPDPAQLKTVAVVESSATTMQAPRIFIPTTTVTPRP